jgi:nucleoside-diphosphate-sugar epimerase
LTATASENDFVNGERLVALTGGTGFVGRHVAAALAKSGWRLRLLARRDPVHPLLADAVPELVLGDMNDARSLAALVRGADAVVHVAGLTKAPDLASFMRVNRDGTALLAEAVARSAPEARRLLVSSLAARVPALSAYAASKRAGETAVRAAPGGAGWTILRPGVVYGPGDLEGLALRRLLAAPLVAVPNGQAAHLAMIHATDLAAAIAAFCASPDPGGDFELSDANPDGYRLDDILGILARLLGRTPPRPLPLPDAVFLGAGRLADAWASATGQRGIFGLGKARELLHRDWRVDPALAPPAALWQPRITLREGLADTVSWWNSSDLNG